MLLTLYLLEKGRYPPSVLDLDGYQKSFQIKIDDSENAQVYLKESGAPPDWLVELGKISSSPPPEIFTSNLKGIFFLRVKQYWIVDTFGHAWQMLSTSEIVRDFGIRCVLNLASSRSLKSIRRNRIASSALQAIEQIPDTDDIARFGMDIEQDLLSGVKARIDESHGFGPSASGTSSLKIDVNTSIESIRSACERAFRTYHRRSYLINFDWFDKIKPERRSNIIEKLDRKLARAVSLRVRSIVMCTPDLTAWDEFDVISYTPRKPRSKPVSQPLDTVQWRNSAGLKRVSVAILKERKIYAYKNDGTSLVSSWPVFNCIHATIKLGSEVFTINNGSWYKLETSFVSRINNEVQNIISEKYRLPKQSRNANLKPEHEGQYNLRISKDFSSRYALMDKNLIPIIGHSTVEVCDLLRRDKTLICVKPWGGKSASLSHLFQQAIVSARLLSESKSYALQVRGKIQDASFRPVWDSVCRSDNTPKFLLATLRGIPKEDLPFFAKVALVNCAKTLRQMRCTVTYSYISM